MIQINDVILGDCLEAMKNIEEHSVSAIITDLPYQITRNHWDSIIPLEPMWKEVYRVLKPRGVFVTTSLNPFTSILIASNIKRFKYCWIWDKGLAAGFLNSKRRPLQRHEDIVVFCDGAETYNPQFWYSTPYKMVSESHSENYGKQHGVITESKDGRRYPISILNFPVHRIKNGHPTQKPVELYKYLIMTYTNSDETVLDIAAGSGTTGQAAIETGRNFICIEKDKKYFDMMKTRIDKFAQQIKLENTI